MAHRLFLPPSLRAGEARTLSAEHGHYLTRVLRLKPGAEVACFDGTGREFDARLSEASGKTVRLQIEALVRSEPQMPPPLHLALGWLKGQAMDTVTQKATELGISDFWPITASRSNVKINRQRTAGRVEHWQKIACHAAEQSTRLFVPTVHEPISLVEYLQLHTSVPKIMLHPGHPPMGTELPHTPLALLVGPEGGWTASEVDAARAAGASVHGLGEWILRAETAPLAALAGIRQLWSWR
jgi:16S rRNA (uracil1498-N3)-methyltransferase